MYTQLIYLIANKIGVSASLLLSICTVETGLKNVNNYQDGNGGSFGVCQVSVPVARIYYPHIGALALQQPDVNVTIAALYLKDLYEKYRHNAWHSVAAYNGGKARIVNGLYRNQVYVNKVKKVYGGITNEL